MGGTEELLPDGERLARLGDGLLVAAFPAALLHLGAEVARPLQPVGGLSLGQPRGDNSGRSGESHEAESHPDWCEP